MQRNRMLVLLGVSGLLGCATSGVPPAREFSVALTPGAEVPVCTAAGPTASGSATVTVAADGKSITASVSYGGLSGAPTQAHIHTGAAGSAGSIVLPFSGTLTSPFGKTFTAADYIAAGDAPPDFAAFVTALKAGNAAYVNVHTPACPKGEIRGELQ